METLIIASVTAAVNAVVTGVVSWRVLSVRLDSHEKRIDEVHGSATRAHMRLDDHLKGHRA